MDLVFIHFESARVAYTVEEVKQERNKVCCIEWVCTLSFLRGDAMKVGEV